MKKFKTIGILGGMGPLASANLYQRILLKAQQKYDAVQDEDYPSIIVNSITLQGFDETAEISSPNIVKQLKEGVINLEKGGADFIVIACNTVHAEYQQMQSAVKIPIVHLIKEVSLKIKQQGYKHVGVVSSQETNKLGLYKTELNKLQLACQVADDDEQLLLNKIILHVMGNTQGSWDKKTLIKIFQKMKAKGAEAFILGCTEIPLAITQADTKLKLFDTLDMIAEIALEKAKSD